MSIAIECPSCHTPFTVDDSFAGRRGTCKNCGTKITIPGMSSAELRAAALPLAKATPQQMLSELARRTISAVLAYSDPLNDSSTAEEVDSDSQDSGSDTSRSLHCIKTSDLTEENVGRILEYLADQVRREQSDRAVATDSMRKDELFELKGDWLGMSLDEFKQKHHRELPELGRSLPWCSDESPGKSIPGLNAEPWHSGAGIVSARIDLPSENASPTIAHEPTESVIYQFLDGKLFQIEVYFATQAFQRIVAEINRKYGKPVSESHSPREISWGKLSVSIEIKFGSIRPPRPARLRYFHDELFRQAIARVPAHMRDG